MLSVLRRDSDVWAKPMTSAQAKTCDVSTPVCLPVDVPSKRRDVK